MKVETRKRLLLASMMQVKPDALFSSRPSSKSLLLVLVILFLAACDYSGTSVTLVEIPVTVEVTRIVTQIALEENEATVEVTRIIPQTVTQETNDYVGLVNNEAIRLNHTGTYRLTRTEDSGCYLLVVHDILETPFEKMRLELACNRGAPSFNSGYALVEVLTAKNLAVYSSEYGECSIVFEFLEDGVKVTQLGESFDCGFGHAVYADGFYQLIDIDPPKLGCMDPQGPDSKFCER